MTTEQDARPGDVDDTEPTVPADGTPAERTSTDRTPGGRWRARGRAAVRRTLHLLRHEWTLAVLGGLLLAIVLTWPTLRDITRTIPQDIGDPILQAWQIAWGGHVLLTDPTQLWHSNTFYPEPYTYAYSDTLLGYAPAGMIGEGPVAAVVRYNILYVLVHALAFVGAYALVRQLGASRIGGAVAGVAFAYAPWRLSQAGHLHVLSVGGIALALAMLARGHGWSLRHGYRPERRRPGWALAGWLVAAWQISLGFGIGLPFGYALGLLCVAGLIGYGWSWWRRSTRPVFGGRLLAADLVGGAVFGAVTLFMALPYLEVVKLHPSGRRTLAHIEMFSPPLRGFGTAPPESWLWGEWHATARESLSFPGEMTLLPGVTLIGLAFAGLFLSAWCLRHRLLLAAGVLVSVVLASGTQIGGADGPYAILVRYFPGWDAIRTPGRLVLWTTLLLGVLAAGALSADLTRPAASPGADPSRSIDPSQSTDITPARRRSARRWPVRLALLVPLALVTVEGVNLTPHATVLPQPAALRDATGPLLVLPSDGILEFSVMLWATDGFPQITNGLASFTPPSQAQTRAMTLTFPDAQSVAYLRDVGIRTVVVLPEYVVGTPWQDVIYRPVDGLGVRREEIAGAVVFRIS
ncbi:hypothetical protein [Micromonospora sonneratiae]|uniref:Dolichyl-phosphate-mannose-protein mannosyltransferase n=1 Tax=Micromonospora sonneratiae TaxID=1184706 RepID=A0ABW3Y6Y2_9ACTN